MAAKLAQIEPFARGMRTSKCGWRTIGNQSIWNVSDAPGRETIKRGGGRATTESNDELNRPGSARYIDSGRTMAWVDSTGEWGDETENG